MDCYRVRVKGTRSRGTGWFVQPRVVVTAFHVVGNRQRRRWSHEIYKRPVKYLLDVGGGQEIELRPLCFDGEADVALLECPAGVVDAQTLPLSDDILKEARWEATGFPALEDGGHFTLTGRITALEEKETRLQLLVDHGSAQISSDGREEKSVWAGMSGSAVCVAGEVVGLFTDVIPVVETNTAYAATIVPIRRNLALYRAGNELSELLRKYDRDLNSLQDLYTRAEDLCRAVGVTRPHRPAEPDALVEGIRQAALRVGPDDFDLLLDAVVKGPEAPLKAVRAFLQAARVQRLRRSQDLLGHWLPRARGAGSSDAWYFSGRDVALRELVEWLKASDSGRTARVVTGAPGTGKSALIARLVILADPEYLAEVTRAGSLEGVREDTIPPVNIIDIAVHAKGKTVGDVVMPIGRTIGLETTNPSRLVDALKTNKRPYVIVLDALDEAADPEMITSDLLQPLATLPNVWLLVGSRPTAPPGESATRVAGLGKVAIEIDLDRGKYIGAEDIAQYVTRRLLAPDEPFVKTPYRGQPELARTVARAVAKKAGNNFLFAQIVSDNLIYADVPVNDTEADWQEKLPNDLGPAIDQFLSRFRAAQFELKKHEVIDLLQPLAYAEGGGLPREENIWASLASVLSGRSYADRDIRVLFEQAGAYIIERREQEHPVYRLFHQAFADYLREEKRTREIQRRITEELRKLTPDRAGGAGKDWLNAHAYVRAHVATHAAAGGMLDDLVVDPLFLVCADKSRLLRVLPKVRGAQAREAAEIYQLVAYELYEPAESASYLEMAARQQGFDAFANRIAELPLKRPWSVRWARWRRASNHRILARQGGLVNAVAAAWLDGRPVIVSGSNNGTIEVRNLDDGNLRYPSIVGDESGIFALAVTELDDQSVLISGGWNKDKTVQVWSLADGHLRYALTGNEKGIAALTTAKIDGQSVIIWGSSDGTVRVLNLSDGHLRYAPLTGHEGGLSGGVSSVATTELDGEPVLVSGGWDKALRIWNLADGSSQPIVFSGQQGRIKSLATAELEGQPVIVCGEYDGTIRILNLADGQLRYTISAHQVGTTRGVLVSVAKIEGQPVIVSGGDDGTLRVWNLADGSPRSAPFTGHQGGVNALVITERDEQPVVISGGNDGTVREWKLVDNATVREPVPGDEEAVAAVATAQIDGQPVVISAGKSLRVMNLTDGHLRLALAGHGGWIRALATADIDRQPVVVSAGEDKTVRVWNLGDGSLVWAKPARNRVWVNALAIAELDGQPVIISGGNDTGSEDGTVQVWDLACGSLRYAAITPGQNQVNAFATAQLGGEPVFISAGSGGMLQVLNLADGSARYFAPAGRNVGLLWALAAAELDGEPVIISGGWYKTVEVWNLADASLRNPPLAGHEDPVRAIATAEIHKQSVIVSGGLDETVRVWNLRDGTLRSAINVGSRVLGLAVAAPCTVVVGSLSGLLVLDFTSEQSPR